MLSTLIVIRQISSNKSFKDNDDRLLKKYTNIGEELTF